jgi:fucose 4-O-acetylase-like acetyltransferase
VRDTRIDSLRAAAILAVILGHAITVSYGRPTAAPLPLAVTFTFAAALGVPLFMFLAGWVARRDADARWMLGRVTRLLVPFAAWTVVQWLLWWRDAGPLRLLELLTHPSATNALWFLPALFLCSIAYALLRRWDALLIAVAVAAVFFRPPLPFFDLPLAALYFPYFVAGHYASRVRFDPRLFAVFSPLLVAAAWGGAGVGLQWTVPEWDVRWATAVTAAPAALVDAPLRFVHVGALLALIAVAFFVAGFGRGPLGLRLPSTLDAGWRWLGFNTLGVYLGHIYFLRLYVHVPWLNVATALASSLAGGVLLTLLFDRWPVTAALFLGCGSGKRPSKPQDSNSRGEAAA